MIVFVLDSAVSVDHLSPVVAGVLDAKMPARCMLVGDAQGLAADPVLQYLAREKDISFLKDEGPELLQSIKATSLVMDMSCGLKPATKGFIEKAKELGIPTFGLPLSCNIDSDEWKPTSYPRLESVEQFDFVCVHRAAWKERLAAAGVDADRIHVIGSPRFCRQWLPALEQAYGNTPWPGANDGRPKALILLTFHPDSSVQMMFGAPMGFAERIVHERELAAALAQCDTLDIVIKPHPKYVDAVPAEVRENCTVAGADIPTPGLCQQADVALGINTSAMLDAFNLHLPIIYPRYVYGLHMAFEDFGCVDVATNPAEAMQKMEQAAAKGATYSTESTNQFLAHVTADGNTERDVLASYAQFLRERSI